TTVEDKALATVGADVIFNVTPESKLTAALTKFGPATNVIRTDSLSIADLQSSLLGVDPAEFGTVAVVGSKLAGATFSDTLDRMRRPTSGMPTVLASAPIPGGVQELITSAGTLKVNVVAVPNLPAQYNGIPIVIANRTQVPAAFFAAPKVQIWSHTSDV